MVNPVGPSGYQAYAYQPSVIAPNDTRGGDNRVERREAPAPDSQRADQRSLASRDEQVAPEREAREEDRSARGRNLDVVA